MKKFSKNTLLLITILLSISILVTGCGQGKQVSEQQLAVKPEENKVYTLKLGHIQPAEHPNGKGAVKFAELVKEKTNGQVIVDVFPASQLGNEKDLFDAVAMGTSDFAILGYGEPAKRFKPALIFDSPYFANDREHLVRIFNDPIVTEIFDDMVNQINVRAIGPFYYGTRYLTTSKVPVRTPEDLKGLKIRTPDQQIYLSTIKSMGATPVPMAFPEVYLALQQGVIDGQENPPATIATNKFYEVQKYLSKTAHILGGNSIYVSEKTLNGLPEELQTAIIEAGEEAATWINNEAFKAEDSYLEQIEANGVTIIEDIDRAAFVERADELFKEYEKVWGEGLLEKIRSIK